VGGYSLLRSSSLARGACGGAEVGGRRGARGGMELISAAAAQATRWQGDIIRSSSPRLLAGASVVEAHRLGGACVELDGEPVASSVRKACQHGRRKLYPVVLHQSHLRQAQNEWIRMKAATSE
jgi:hypothetical protein